MVKNFKAGDVILFNNSRSFFAKQIEAYNYREYGKSKCTHSGIVSKVLNDRIIVFEIVNLKGAIHREYSKKEINKLIRQNKIIVRRPERKIENVFAICNLYLNIKYSAVDILMIGLFGLTGLQVSLSKTKSVSCSELTCRVLYDASIKRINFENEFKKKFDLISPMDLYLSKQLRTIR